MYKAIQKYSNLFLPTNKFEIYLYKKLKMKSVLSIFVLFAIIAAGTANALSNCDAKINSLKKIINYLKIKSARQLRQIPFDNLEETVGMNDPLCDAKINSLKKIINYLKIKNARQLRHSSLTMTEYH